MSSSLASASPVDTLREVLTHYHRLLLWQHTDVTHRRFYQQEQAKIAGLLRNLDEA